jgi:hypothetical protein
VPPKNKQKTSNSSDQRLYGSTITPALGRLRQEDYEFRATLGYNSYSSDSLPQKKKKVIKSGWPDYSRRLQLEVTHGSPCIIPEMSQ